MSEQGTPRNMVCPKCGKFQERADECAHCGIIVAKYKESQEARQERESAPREAPARLSATSIDFDFARMGRIVIFALAAALGWYLYGAWGDSQYDELQAQFNTLPGYAELKQYDPTTFAKLERMVERAKEERASPEKIYRDMRDLIMKSVLKFIPTTSDQAINHFARTYIAMTKRLEEENPTLCFQLLTQRATLSKVHKAADTGEQMTIMETFGALIRDAAENPQPVPDGARVEPVISALASRLADRYGPDLMYMQQPQLAAFDTVKQKTVCAITNDLYDMILAKPPASSSRLLRYMMAQG